MSALDNSPLTDPLEARHILKGAIGQIRFARQYTLELLGATPPERWFEIPDGLPTHIAWQVGHLTVSQYGLLMFRIRGRQPDDLTLIPSWFRKSYSRQSQPSADARSKTSGQPTVEELTSRLSEVFERALAELSTVPAEVLLEPVEMPYAAYPNKLGAILFCPLHEHIHAGQIGLVRRGLGLAPIR